MTSNHNKESTRPKENYFSKHLVVKRNRSVLGSIYLYRQNPTTLCQVDWFLYSRLVENRHEQNTITRRGHMWEYGNKNAYEHYIRVLYNGMVVNFLTVTCVVG